MSVILMVRRYIACVHKWVICFAYGFIATSSHGIYIQRSSFTLFLSIFRAIPFYANNYPYRRRCMCQQNLFKRYSFSLDFMCNKKRTENMIVRRRSTRKLKLGVANFVDRQQEQKHVHAKRQSGDTINVDVRIYNGNHRFHEYNAAIKRAQFIIGIRARLGVILPPNAHSASTNTV